MAMSFLALLGALLAAPPDPPKTTCVPESGAGALAVTRMGSTAPGGPRWLPLAAWTGTELLLWAREPAADSGEAARWTGWGWAYAPATDRWRRLSGPRPPPIRTEPSLTWAGTAAILWGGLEGNRRTSGGISFDPTTGRFKPISARGAPSPRSEQEAFWTGSELIVFGGLGEAGSLCDGGRYQPSKDAWTPIPSPVGSPRCEGLSSRAPLATWAGGRLVAVIGHFPGAFSAFAYDPGSGQWTAIPPSAAPSQLLTFDLVPGPDGFAYAVGSQPGWALPYLYRLDFQRKAWVPVAPACGLDQLTTVGGTLMQLGPDGACVFDVPSAGCRSLLEPAGPGVTFARSPQVAVPAGSMTLLWHGAGEVVRLGSSAPAPSPPGEGALVKGRATMTVQTYCGGAPPPPRMVLQSTNPAGGVKLLVRRGKVNRGGPVVAEVTTDRLGLFELRLPPGEYCLIEEGKRDLSPSGVLPQFADAQCMKAWREACDATFKVEPGQAAVATGVSFFHECFGKCYRGPLPP